MVMSRPAALIHCATVSSAKPEAAVRVLLAQEFQIVRREIDHQQAAARRQHARGLADRAAAVVEEVQHLMDDDDVERARRHREIVDVALPHAAMAQARALDAGAGEQQHVERQVDAEPALEVGAEHFQDAAGAGAEIEQRAERLVGERIADRAAPPPRPATCSLRMRSHCAACARK